MGGASTSYYIYPPLLASNPTFALSSANVTTTFTFTPGPELILDPATGSPTNAAEAAGGVLNVTSEVPSGYAFDTSTPPATVKTWSVPYQGCMASASAI